jgi:acyl-homoserine lactone synthase
MICHCVTAANRSRYAAQLDEMFRQRHEVFVDCLGWRELRRADKRDIDDYDHDDTVYLLVIGDAGEVLASGRMNPTWGRHQLEEGGPLRRRFATRVPPNGPRIWEGSRLVGGFPERYGREFARETLYMVLVALQEFAVRRGIVEAVSILEMPALARFQSMGWETVPLGIPTQYDTDRGRGEALAAIWKTGPRYLASARLKTGIRAPIVYEAPPALASDEPPPPPFQLFDSAAELRSEEARAKALAAIHDLLDLEMRRDLKTALN